MSEDTSTYDEEEDAEAEQQSEPTSSSSESMDEEERRVAIEEERREAMSRLLTNPTLRSALLFSPLPERHGVAAAAGSVRPTLLALGQAGSVAPGPAHAARAGHSAAAAAAWPNASAAARPPARAAGQRASEAIRAASPLGQRQSRAASNYPPVQACDCLSDGIPAQIYRLDDWEHGLTQNSRLLNTYVSRSKVLPDGKAGLGLFASRDFEEGEVVDYLWGKFVTTADWESISRRHHDNTFIQGEENYVLPVQQGIHRVIGVPAQPETEADMLLASEQCPVAYINQGDGQGADNVQIVVPLEAFDPDTPASCAYRYLPFVVRTQDQRGVSMHEEFTTQYHWGAGVMEQLKAKYVKHLAQLNGNRFSAKGKYDNMRAGRVDASSVRSHTSSDSSRGSVDSYDPQKAQILECDGRDAVYKCCQKKHCWKATTPAWVRQIRSATHSLPMPLGCSSRGAAVAQSLTGGGCPCLQHCLSRQGHHGRRQAPSLRAAAVRGRCVTEQGRPLSAQVRREGV